MGIKGMLLKSADSAAGTLSKLSVLSQEELEKVEQKRRAYLQKMPDPTDINAKELTERLLSSIGVEIYQSYLSQLKDLYLPLSKSVELAGEAFDANRNIRFINITRWVIDKNEDSLEKLINVYSVLSSEEVNISLVFHRTQQGTSVFLALTNTKNANNNTEVEKVYKARLIDALRGNFPGSKWEGTGIGKIPILDNKKPYSVAVASNIPTEKSEKFISQTIEKLIDGFVPSNAREEYILILMASPIRDVEERKLRLAELYSSLAPYANWQTNFTFNDSSSFGSSATVGVNVGASAGIQNTASKASNQSYSDSYSESDTEGHTKGQTEGKTKGESRGKTKGNSVQEGKSIGIGFDALGFINISANGSLSFQQNSSTSVTKSVSKSLSKSVSQNVSKTLGRAVSSATGVTNAIAKGTSFGVNFGANFARTSNVTATLGYGEGITQNFTNYSIKNTLDLLEKQMERYLQSTALGLWDFSAYVLSEDHNVANNIAHSYLALTQGQESFMSQSSINVWRGDLGEDSQDAKEITDYLRELRHPLFALNPNLLAVDDGFSAYPSLVTATTPLSGKELAYSLNFPRKSISGLPVVECVGFGRNIARYDVIENNTDRIQLGHIFHMNNQESTIVDLSLESLTSHVFVTGSTGSGKSNTIYQMIHQCLAKGIKCLVIEPAKGEYKEIFGGREDVSVFGTNPYLANLLKINPFSFPKGIHVLEHLDRLVEIFNNAWPMYAAMPAILKEAIEKSYQECGWNLMTSKNAYHDIIYPTFEDVLSNIRTIIDSSDYDAENKGAYKGALVTRLKSLATGLNKLIFDCNELSNQQLFDANVIVDLSRVGSSETKSLLMGMLVLKLQEYRMTQEGLNSSLKHLTVLEEAHHLLKRSSTSSGGESANLSAKSVELLANAIAEMRTYGEGFIIADQSPNLLDLSVIRNTNTKIIMRLPDQSDRELVGRSANLTNDQISEVAKLPKGVAAVYQQDWIEPVLCQVSHCQEYEPIIKEECQLETSFLADDSDLLDDLLDFATEILFKNDYSDELLSLKSRVLHSHLTNTLKISYLNYINQKSSIDRLLYDAINVESIRPYFEECETIEVFIETITKHWPPILNNLSSTKSHFLISTLLEELYQQSNKAPEYESLCESFYEFQKKREVE